MAYGVEVVKGVVKAFLDYGDNFPFVVEAWEDAEHTIPSDLTGRTFILGIETLDGISVNNIVGTVVENVITFNIFYDVYSIPQENAEEGVVAEEGKTYNFDYWDSTLRNTVPMGTLEFRKVAHRTEV